MAALIIKSGKHKGKKLALPAKEVFIGRDEECQIRLATNEISRKHCVLRCRREGLFVQDLQSRNGTLVNGTPIQHETHLKPGDSLQVGPMLFQVAGKKQEVSNEPQATDENILDWLSDDESTNDGTGSGDTTIIKAGSELHAQVDAAAQEAQAETAKAAPRKQFKSIAEEGAEIIRRHLELVREK